MQAFRFRFYVLLETVIIFGGMVRQRGNADPRRRKSFSETRCKGETNTETVINKQVELYSDGTEKKGRH